MELTNLSVIHMITSINRVIISAKEMASIPSDSGIVVMTSARKRDQLDKSLLNTGFMELEIKLYPPNQAERRSILAR